MTPEDLLIHKLIKLRNDKRKLLQDASDIRALVEARGANLDLTYLRTWLPPEQAELVRTAAAVDEAELVARLAKS